MALGLADTGRMRQRLSAAQVAELAELLEDAPIRAGVIDAVLQAAAEGRGMTLVLTDERPDRNGLADSDGPQGRRRRRHPDGGLPGRGR